MKSIGVFGLIQLGVWMFVPNMNIFSPKLSHEAKILKLQCIFTLKNYLRTFNGRAILAHLYPTQFTILHNVIKPFCMCLCWLCGLRMQAELMRLPETISSSSRRADSVFYPSELVKYNYQAIYCMDSFQMTSEKPMPTFCSVGCIIRACKCHLL